MPLLPLSMYKKLTNQKQELIKMEYSICSVLYSISMEYNTEHYKVV